MDETDETCHFCSKPPTTKVLVTSIEQGIEEVEYLVCKEHRKMLKQIFDDDI